MNKLNALSAEDTFKIKILYIQRPSNLSGAVVCNPRSAASVSTVRYIELMAITPRPPLLNLSAFKRHTAPAEIALDKAGDRTVFYKSRKHFYRQTEIRRDTCNISFRTRRLKFKSIAAMNGLSFRRGNTNSHTRRNNKRPHTILFEFFHYFNQTFRKNSY